MQKGVSRSEKFIRFVRNNVALLIIIACILAITAIVIGVSLKRDASVPVNVEDPTQQAEEEARKEAEKAALAEKKKFILPFTYTEVGMNYTDDSENLFVFNQTLDVWSAHRAVDLKGSSGSAVLAIRDGTVTETGFTYGYGNYVKVDHGDGIVATYASLGETLQVKAGDVVTKGAQLGVISQSASYEMADGEHLHLAMTLDGKAINPWNYIPLPDKTGE